MPKLTIEITEKAHSVLKERAKSEERSLTQYITLLLDDVVGIRHLLTTKYPSVCTNVHTSTANSDQLTTDPTTTNPTTDTTTNTINSTTNKPPKKRQFIGDDEGEYSSLYGDNDNNKFELTEEALKLWS